MATTKKPYNVENIWLGKTNSLVDEIIAFWALHKALGRKSQSRQRAQQVLHIARGTNGKIVALTTAYKRYNEQLDNYFWYYRCFVAPAYRKTHVAQTLLFLGRDYLNQRFLDGFDSDAIGLFVVVENKRLMENRNEGVWRSGLTYIGKDKKGRHQRVKYFDNARISDSHIKKASEPTQPGLSL